MCHFSDQENIIYSRSRCVYGQKSIRHVHLLRFVVAAFRVACNVLPLRLSSPSA